MSYLRESVIKIHFHNYSPFTYLANKSENIEATYTHKEAPWGAKHSKPIELCEKHDVHHKTADYHKCEFGTLVFSEEVVQTRCEIKYSVFNAFNWVGN